MAQSSPLTTLYASDEQVYTFASADYAVIAPNGSCYGYGADGAVANGDPWTLTSATNNFTTQGAAAGMMLQLIDPKGSFTPKRSLYFVVDTVGSTSLTFRHPGEVAGKGMPPVAAAGLTGITFSVLSIKAQIENAAFKLNEKFSVDPNLTYRTPSDAYDLRVFRDLTAYWVVYHLYADANRTKDGDFAMKIAFYKEQYEAALASATLRWGTKGNSQPATNFFGTRLSR